MGRLWRGRDTSVRTSQTVVTYLRTRRKRIIVTLLLLLTVWLFVGGSDGFWAHWRMTRNIKALQRENAELRAQNIKLQEQITRLKLDSLYIERIARERYGMAQPGERVYRIIPNASQSSER